MALQRWGRRVRPAVAGGVSSGLGLGPAGQATRLLQPYPSGARAMIYWSTGPGRLRNEKANGHQERHRAVHSTFGNRAPGWRSQRSTAPQRSPAEPQGRRLEEGTSRARRTPCGRGRLTGPTTKRVPYRRLGARPLTQRRPVWQSTDQPDRRALASRLVLSRDGPISAICSCRGPTSHPLSPSNSIRTTARHPGLRRSARTPHRGNAGMQTCPP